jgi:hypothetical protein
MGDRSRKDWASNSPEYRKAEYEKAGGSWSSKEHYRKNRDALLAKSREKYFQSHYGISTSRFEEICVSQGHMCAICRKPEAENHHGRLAVDHDHKTGLVRGLLCHNCNRALGLMQDSAGLLRAAADYLGEG